MRSVPRLKFRDVSGRIWPAIPVPDVGLEWSSSAAPLEDRFASFLQLHMGFQFYVKSEDPRFDRVFPNFDNFKQTGNYTEIGKPVGRQWPEVLL